MEYLEIILVFILGFWLGKRIGYVQHKLEILHKARMRGVDLSDVTIKVSKQTVLETETHGPIILLFDRQQNKFLCQGNSIEEVIENLMKYHSDIDIAKIKHLDKIFTINNGKLVEE